MTIFIAKKMPLPSPLTSINERKQWFMSFVAELYPILLYISTLIFESWGMDRIRSFREKITEDTFATRPIPERNENSIENSQRTRIVSRDEKFERPSKTETTEATGGNIDFVLTNADTRTTGRPSTNITPLARVSTSKSIYCVCGITFVR